MLDVDFHALAAAANSDGEFAIAGRFWNAALEITIGDTAVELLIVDGVIEGVGATGSHSGAHERVAVRAAEEDWAKLLSRRPPPGWVGVAGANGFSYEGDPLTRAAYYAAVRRIVELIRLQVNGVDEPLGIPGEDGLDEALVGRYVGLEVEGVRYRVYYEESGAPDGIPLVMQHTAGSDGRQWRHVLADADDGRDFRLLAYDLPFHGKSSPPTGVRWWEQQYMPTKAWLLEFLDAFSVALGLRRPVFMGCSIGGLMAPTSPPSAQRETAWAYGAGAPPVFFGDIVLYSTQFRLSEADARRIDTSQVAVYLLTGEYDPFAINGGAALLAGWIAGAHHHVIEAAGHFAPSDNPARFKAALDPVLKEIASGG